MDYANKNTRPSHPAGRGYASHAYAASLGEFGELIHLPLSDGYLLKRGIPGTDEYDAMGCYPLFFCEDWARLKEDLTNLPADIVSVTLVTDPFGRYSKSDLDECFDVVNPFKHHFIVDLEEARDSIGTKHHRKEARKALKHIRVEACNDPVDCAESWYELYDNLRIRHNIQGIRAFSNEAFLKQLKMPEMVMHQAFYGDELVGAQLYLVQNDTVHCHLGAVTDVGYKRGAFYALDSYSYEYFGGTVRWLDLGGGVGCSGDGEDGLNLYKKGWSAETRPVYFCGCIMNPERYAALVRERGQEETHYFPAYREGEFD